MACRLVWLAGRLGKETGKQGRCHSRIQAPLFRGIPRGLLGQGSCSPPRAAGKKVGLMAGKQEPLLIDMMACELLRGRLVDELLIGKRGDGLSTGRLDASW